MGLKECWDEEAGGFKVSCLYDLLVEKDRVIEKLAAKAFDEIIGVAYNDRVVDADGIGHAGPFIVRLRDRGHFAVTKHALRARILEWFWKDLEDLSV